MAYHTSSDINLQTLVDHYTKKFAPPRNINDTIRSSQQCVDDKINNLTLHDQQITQTMDKRYICKLKLNELLRNICSMVLTATFPIKLPTCCHYALNIVLYLTFLLTVC